MPKATITQCAILAGGLGSRLGELTAITPKPVLRCGDRPFLAWLMREFVRFGVEDFLLLTGHLSNDVCAAVEEFATNLPSCVRITISKEPAQSGTGGALYYARQQLQQRFLLCNGDSLFDCNLGELLAAAAADSGSVVGRLLLRRQDDTSRYGIVETRGDVVTAFHDRSITDRPFSGGINAGIYVFDRQVLDDVSPICSLEQDVMPRLAQRRGLRATVGSGYFIDIGIPADLARAQDELPKILRRPALVFDLATLLDVDYRHVATYSHFDWMPGAMAAVRFAVSSGWHVFVVPSHSKNGFIHLNDASMQDVMQRTAEELRRMGGTFDDWRYRAAQAETALRGSLREVDRREPASKLLLDLMHIWEIDPRRCVLVGSTQDTIHAAKRAGVSGVRFSGGDLATFIGNIPLPPRQSVPEPLRPPAYLTTL